MREQTCSNCRYGWGFEEGLGGECKRYPPTVVQTKEITKVGLCETTKSIWPFIRSHDWCGEWREPVAPSGTQPTPIKRTP